MAKMAAGLVAFRLLIHLLFVSLFLSPGHNQHLGFTVSACTVVRRFLPRHLRVKLPISNWSKHGQTTIVLPDKQYVSRADIVLLCGDLVALQYEPKMELRLRRVKFL